MYSQAGILLRTEAVRNSQQIPDGRAGRQLSRRRRILRKERLLRRIPGTTGPGIPRKEITPHDVKQEIDTQKASNPSFQI